MRRRRRLTLLYAKEVREHVRKIERRYHRLICTTIEEPGPFGATWELKSGPANRFRVFYQVVQEGAAVWILAIGIKTRNRLLIGGEEFES